MAAEATSTCTWDVELLQAFGSSRSARRGSGTGGLRATPPRPAFDKRIRVRRCRTLRRTAGPHCRHAQACTREASRMRPKDSSMQRPACSPSASLHVTNVFRRRPGSIAAQILVPRLSPRISTSRSAKSSAASRCGDIPPSSRPGSRASTGNCSSRRCRESVADPDAGDLRHR